MKLNKKMNYVIGIDYGSDSCRALVVNTKDGEVIATSVQYYPRWGQGLFCNALKNQYRQHPLDYLETLERVVKEVLIQCPEGTANQIVGLGFDMTASTPALTDEMGTPLALLSEFAENPNAMFMLWKDHTSIAEAEEINQLARNWKIDYTAYEGGIYSSEWVWSKVLHVLRNDENIRKKAYAFVEHCDWIPGVLTGNTKPETMVRSRCVAGHKAMWHESWGGLPDEDFLTNLSPLLKGFRSRMYSKTYTNDKQVGYLTAEWAGKLGLHTGVSVGIGAIDCHVGAVGVAIKPRTLVRVIGTSTCDIMVVPYDQMQGKLIPGICGQVDGSVIPGMIGLEAGQSAFGDIFAWFKRLLEWPLENILSETLLIDENTKAKLKTEISRKIISDLTAEAEKIPIKESFLLATDWLNGRRTPDADPLLMGTITGLTLGTTAPMIFRALVEATAFGSKAIVDRFLENGIQISEVIGIGGISLKSPFVMQTMSDVLGMPIKVARSEQACALGAAMFAAVSAGVYATIQDSQVVMQQGFVLEYYPDKDKHCFYRELYKKYCELN